MKRVLVFIASLLRKLADSTEYVNCPNPECRVRQPIPEQIETGLLYADSDQNRLLYVRYVHCWVCSSAIPLETPDRSPPYGESPPMWD